MSGAWLTAFSAAALLLVALLAGSPPVWAAAPENPKAAEANLSLGVAYYKADNLPIAKEKLERARDQNPKSPQVHGALALLYARLGDEARADAEFNTALKLAPADPEQLNNYAVYLCSRGKTDAGVQRFEQAAANPLYKTPWAAHTNAGVCLRSAKREADAAAQFDKALKDLPSYAEAVFQYADLELAQQQPGLAYRRIETYLNSNPKANADLLYTGWRAARAQGDQLSALKLARRLQTDFSGTEQARVVTGGVNGSR